MMPKSSASTESRERILQAALKCFLRKGYNNTTMDDIVAESNLSKGTLYWYFDSKKDLFNAALTSVAEDLDQGTSHIQDSYSTASDKLRAISQAAVSIGEEAPSFFSLFLEFWASSSHSQRGEVGAFWLDMLEEYRNTVTDIIEEGIASGEFRPVDAEPLVWALLAAYDGLAAYLTLKPDLDLAQINEALTDVLIKGLLADGAST